MRQTEQKLWDRMRNRLGAKTRLERIENIAGVGTPDVFVLVEGTTTPVELKAVIKPPARDTTRVLGDKGLNRDQRNWHLSWSQWGGISYVLIGVGPREIYLINGRHADAINNLTIIQLAAHSVARNWDDVYVVLKGELP